jgi:cytochrome c oxidase subunit 1
MRQHVTTIGNRTSPDTSVHDFVPQDRLLISAYVWVGYVMLLLGVIAGLLQVLDRTGLLNLPRPVIYYQLLTAHGIVLALVFTTFFIVGYLLAGVAKTMGGRLIPAARNWGWAGFYTMTAGVVITLVEVISNRGTVLYTFYAPMGASAAFYIGLALLVVGSWLSGIAIFIQYGRWRREHPGQRSPLFAFMAVATFVLWIVATIGVAVEVVFLLIPWALGWTETVNVMLSRALFWYFGHPLVYFWLLPVYIIWYISLPKIIGSHIFSDSLARLAFILLIIFSLPVGFHHDLTAPGIPAGWKYLQVALTMAVVFPSMMTAFAVVGTLEQAGRKKGGRGLLSWMAKLPWGDARFLAMFIAMLAFIPVGASGIINGSFQLNQLVHNTLFITGHFHLAIATTTVLTFFAASYYLIPTLTGRVFTATMNRLGIFQALFWGGGMITMSIAMYISGILGEPRRTSFTTYMDHPVREAWTPYHIWMAIGGTLAFIGGILFLIIVANLFFFAPKATEKIQFPIAETVEDIQSTPAILERWSIWIPVMIGLVTVAYLIPTWNLFVNAPPGMPPIQTW